MSAATTMLLQQHRRLRQQQQQQQSLLPQYECKAKTLALCSLALFAICAVVWEGLVVPTDVSSQRRRNSSNGNGIVAKKSTFRYKSTATMNLYAIPDVVDVEIANFVESSIPTVAPQDGAENANIYNPLHNCSVTSQVQIYAPTENFQQQQQQQRWILQAVDRFGRAKTVGGDEFYITYHEALNDDDDNSASDSRNRSSEVQPPTAVALITDRQDGTYELDFVTPPAVKPLAAANSTSASTHVTTSSQRRHLTEKGELKVYFLYSCGIGNASKPLKDSWKFGGNTNIHHTASVPPPPMRPFVPPNSSVDLGSFQTIVFHGDSLIRQFSIYFKEWGNKRKMDHGFSYRQNTNMFLAQSTIEAWLQSLDDWHGDVLRNAGTKNVALVTGSSTWDITKGTELQGPSFDDHLSVVRRLVHEVRTRYPKVTLLWKLPVALHLQMADSSTCWNVTQNPKCVQRLAYMSEARVKFVRQQQAAIMAELNVPVLDVYEGSYLSAHYHQPGDSVHYEDVFSQHMINWFFTEKRNFSGVVRGA